MRARDDLRIRPDAVAAANGPALARDFDVQLKRYLGHCLRQGLCCEPGSEEGPAAYRHDPLLLPAAVLAQLPAADAELAELLRLCHGQRQIWRRSLDLRRSLPDLRPGADLPELIAARCRLERGYAESDRLALMLDQLERRGLPVEALAPLETVYVEALLALEALQQRLESDWLWLA